MNAQEISPTELLAIDTNCLLLAIDKKIRRPIPSIDFLLVVEEIENTQFLFPKFYKEVLESVYKHSFLSLSRISTLNNSFNAIEKAGGIYACCSLAICSLASIFLSLSFSFQVQVLVFYTVVFGSLIICRKILNNKLRISVDRLTIVAYLMERNTYL